MLQLGKLYFFGALQDIKKPKFHNKWLTFFRLIYHKAKLEGFYSVNKAR